MELHSNPKLPTYFPRYKYKCDKAVCVIRLRTKLLQRAGEFIY
jgi:hypothetical protein